MKNKKNQKQSFLFRNKIRNQINKNKYLKSSGYYLFDKYFKLTKSLHVEPDYLIIGAPRSASTSLYQYLIQHPCITPAITKQIHYFDRYFYKGFSWYKSCMPYKIEKFYKKNIIKENFITGEATVHYFLHPLAPERIFNFLPNVKLILTLRDPVERAYSHWNMEFQNKNETLSFEDAIKIEESRMDGEIEKLMDDDRYESINYPHRAYLTTGRYIEHLEKWLKFFPSKQFCIIDSDELARNPSTQFNKIIEFLELPKFDLVNYPKLHSRNYSKMDLKIREELKEYYKPYNNKLFSMIGKNFEW